MAKGIEEECLDCGKPRCAWIGAIRLIDESGSVCGDCAQARCSLHDELKAKVESLTIVVKDQHKLSDIASAGLMAKYKTELDQ